MPSWVCRAKSVGWDKWIDGIVSIGQQSSKNTFIANKHSNITLNEAFILMIFYLKQENRFLRQTNMG